MPWVQDELPLAFPTSLDKIRDCPDCEQGKCAGCGGDTLDNIRDRLAPCPCAVRGH